MVLQAITDWSQYPLQPTLGYKEEGKNSLEVLFSLTNVYWHPPMVQGARGSEIC